MWNDHTSPTESQIAKLMQYCFTMPDR